MINLLHKIQNLIKKSLLHTVSSDTEGIPITTITYFGRKKEVQRLSVYGIDSNPPVNCLCTGLTYKGNESDEVVIPQDVINRIKGLKAGEVALHNTVTDNYILLKENGDMEIICTGNLTATVDGDATITATNINLVGNVSITGTLDVSGTTTLEGKTFLTHQHSGVTTGSGSTGGVV